MDFYTPLEKGKPLNTVRFHNAKFKAQEKLFVLYWGDYYNNNSEDLLKYIPPERQEDFQKYVAKSKGKRWKYAMYTINFGPGVELNVIKKYTEKCLKKKWILDPIYCYETRGRDENGGFKGVHVHMRVQFHEDKNPYEGRREVYNTFKHVVGNKQHINVRYSNRDDAFIEYIAGYKKGEKKEHHSVDHELNVVMASM